MPQANSRKAPGSRMTRRQHDLIGMFVLGEIGDVEFTELALEAEMSLSAIGSILKLERSNG